jgi:DtxR family Mn-dependent transcriptional regulator
VTTQKKAQLTPALEDYLEAIYNLCRFNKAAHSRDIAEALNVHKSTVTAALRSLGNMGLINYAPYEAVTLTAEGRKKAENVVWRHKALRDFFVDVLKVDEEMAETAACGMEHSVPAEIVEKLAEFAAFIEKCPRNDGEWLKDASFACHGGGGEANECLLCLEDCVRDFKREGIKKRKHHMEESMTLDAIPVGGKAEVVSLKGDGSLRRRIAEMGITRGSLIQVERVAPLGDPLDILVKGYHLSLRKDEAANVVVTRA